MLILQLELIEWYEPLLIDNSENLFTSPSKKMSGGEGNCKQWMS
jgi:hypothetical protein